jgi:hypothetical protein
MPFAEAPISFRNVVRYSKEPEENAKLYQAVGFELVSRRGDMITLQNAEGLSVILHQYVCPHGGRRGGGGKLNFSLFFSILSIHAFYKYKKHVRKRARMSGGERKRGRGVRGVREEVERWVW